MPGKNVPSLAPIINRLSRLNGQLGGVIDMLRENQTPGKVAQQMSGVEAAFAATKRAYLDAHVQHCIDQRDMSGGALRELKLLTKFL